MRLGISDQIEGLEYHLSRFRDSPIGYIKNATQIHSKQDIRDWLTRRRLTIGLALFFLIWHGLQQLVRYQLGWETATWWFYVTPGGFWPGVALAPGIILAPISHNMEKLSHLVANTALFVFAGAVVEPYISRWRYLFTVLGLGLLSIWFSNWLLVTYDYGVMKAGASGGIMALWAYGGLIRMYQLWDSAPGTETRAIEIYGIIVLLLGSVVFTIFELTENRNVGHVMGLMFGFVTAGVKIADVLWSSRS